MADFNFQNLLEHIPEAVIVLDPQDQIIFFNRKVQVFEKITGRSIAVGLLYIDLISPDRKHIVQHVLESVKVNKTMQVLETENKDQDGRFIYYECIYDPVLNSDNNVEYICVFFKEKTIEKIFEKRSTQLLTEYSNLIEYANAVIFSMDSKLYITGWNTECERITQYTKDEVFTRKIDQFVAEQQMDQFNLFMSGILNNHPVANFELCFIRKDGTIVIILLNATPKLSAVGEVIGILFVGHDVTELSEYRKSLELKIKDGTEKLKQALEKEKELVDIRNKFVSIASHEFRIPLSTITTSVNHVKRNSNLSESDNEKLTIIEKQISHMRSLMEDVLTLGKAESAKLKSKNQKLNLILFLQSLIREVTEAHVTHKVKFQFSSTDVEISSDEKLLRNVFINLLTNAIKFSPGHNVVDMVLEQEDNGVKVRITDYGIGISEIDLARIFEPFNRGSNTGSIKGTGLGLSIVKRAVEVLGGSLSIESKVGTGTSIIVKLPIQNLS